MIFASLVLCVKRIKVVLKSQLGFCNRLRTLPDVLITFLWTLLRSYLSLMVMMRFLQLWIDFLVWLDLCLCRLLQQLQMLLNCSLIIGCVNLVFLARLSVTEMWNFSLLFGNLYVLSCRVELPWVPVIIHRQMALLRDTIVVLSRFWDVSVLLLSLIGVLVCHRLSLLLIVLLLMLISTRLLKLFLVLSRPFHWI